MDDSFESPVPLKARFHSASPLADTTYGGPENADLSLSELSLNEKPGPSAGPSRPFSLLARPLRPPEPQPPEPDIAKLEVEDEADGNDSDIVESEIVVEDEETRLKSMARTREERLRQNLFVLRKLNSGFAVYNDALSDTRSSTERVAEQLQQTNALLDKYVDILANSEIATRMIFDERWHGADDDDATLERLAREVEEKARREVEERALAVQKEKDRKEKEERERQERAEKERAEIEKREKLAIRAGYGGVRGVRGTRASARARGAAVARSSNIRGRGSSIPSATTTGNRYSKPASTSTASSRSGVR
ncbi:hypothetical protein DFH11DRAFT_452689 [Phellopilus nigrolimitatus]|nr:hypothetical protein DFH11DRAFT_452689 [Phellopilus nigrolimitatus]